MKATTKFTLWLVFGLLLGAVSFAALVVGVVMVTKRKPKWIFGSKKRFRRPKNRIVFSLSTIPSRLPAIEPTVRSLLGSTVRPNVVYLVLPRTSAREKTVYKIPGWLKRLDAAEDALKILRPDQDYGPITKIYPVLTQEPHPETMLLLADDDELYPKDYHEDLVRFADMYPDAAVGYRGVRLANGTWPKDSITNGQDVDILETYTGVVYRRKFLEGIMPFPQDSPCFFTDDIVLAAQLRRLNVAKRTLPGLPLGHPKGAGNPHSPLQPRNDVAAVKPLSDMNMYRGNRNQKCLEEIWTPVERKRDEHPVPGVRGDSVLQSVSKPAGGGAKRAGAGAARS